MEGFGPEYTKVLPWTAFIPLKKNKKPNLNHSWFLIKETRMLTFLKKEKRICLSFLVFLPSIDVGLGKLSLWGWKWGFGQDNLGGEPSFESAPLFLLTATASSSRWESTAQEPGTALHLSSYLFLYLFLTLLYQLIMEWGTHLDSPVLAFLKTHLEISTPYVSWLESSASTDVMAF